jgi:dTDP-4-dehydrorhamnose reductase
MRIVVTGCAGFVGRCVAEHLDEHGHEVIGAFHRHTPALSAITAHQFDVTDESEVQRLLQEFTPDIIVHAAALVDADHCERDPEYAWETNVTGTKNVVRNAEEFGSAVLLVSSSFVFSGTADQYVESDTRDPVNVYGETKVAAEKTVGQAPVPSTVVRIDQPYGVSTSWQTPTMVEWVRDKLTASEEPVEVFADWSNNPIHNHDIAVCIRLLLEGGHRGIYHVVGPEHISRYHWARRIAAVIGHDVTRIEPSHSADSGLPAERPNANLSTTKLVSQIGYAPEGIYQGLQRMAHNVSTE